MKELPKVYDPNAVEKRIYKMWEDNGCFSAERDPAKKPFTIVMPPPNVTGQLHMGHAMDCTLQDALIRFKRMQGYSALWVPGTDHAGIATQIKVEENLRAEGLTRYDLGREKFLERVWDWKNKYGNRIVEQQKTLGASCDWNRSRFTMDEGCSKAVREVFVSLYEKGLIYKGNRIINWCPHCVTALSDAEVEYQEKEGSLWYLKYPIKGENRYLIVATTRPETMMGDTGVAVNPNDDRYKDLVGKTCILPIMNREIPIVADEYVDMEFGTGCVKMTPAHDPNDFEVGKRHNLEVIRVLDDHGVVNQNGGPYEGMDRYDCRKKVVEDLEQLGLIEKIEPYSHSVGTCYRCHNDVEPIISNQWFVKMKPLAKEAIRVVKDGEVVFVPDRFSKVYLNWMENVHDWCISRQLWWGHQIPVWYCDDCGALTVSREDATCCSKCGSKNIHQDPDVLDTWFSSALWPFSTLGWPDQTPDLKYFYPTDVLVTGYDIIFFWVARMIFSGCEHTHKAPFHTVFIHGLVRDENGKKMSKSAGNGIDPLVICQNYGADALRLNLITGISPGNDMRFYKERCNAMRNFANKLWNAARFLQMNLTIDQIRLPEKLELEDKWILDRINNLIPEITENMDRYELGVAAQKIYDFVWYSYCDWYIEFSKARLNSGEEKTKIAAQQVLCYVLNDILKLLHPFMPFITEEIWQSIPNDSEFLIKADWPKFREDLVFKEEAETMEGIMDIIKGIRSKRHEMNAQAGRKASITVVSDQADQLKAGEPFLMKMAYASSVTFQTETPVETNGTVCIVTDKARTYIPLADLVDLEKERKRLENDLKKNREARVSLQKKLENPGFLNKAPKAVVDAEKERFAKLTTLIEQIEESLKTI